MVTRLCFRLIHEYLPFLLPNTKSLKLKSMSFDRHPGARPVELMRLGVTKNEKVTLSGLKRYLYLSQG